jgi:hypothetical protein
MLLKSIDRSVYKFFVIFIALLFGGCKDNVYVNNNLKDKINCLSYIPVSKNSLDLGLLKLYKFNSNCPYKLNLEYKDSIACNSSFNAPTKATTAFPNSYIKLEVKNGFKIVYSYYKDLTSKPDLDDLEDAFDRLKEDILKN